VNNSQAVTRLSEIGAECAPVFARLSNTTLPTGRDQLRFCNRKIAARCPGRACNQIERKTTPKYCRRFNKFSPQALGLHSPPSANLRGCERVFAFVEGAKSGNLVLPHQTAIALDIGCEDRGELSLDGVRFQGSAPPNREHSPIRRENPRGRIPS